MIGIRVCLKMLAVAAMAWPFSAMAQTGMVKIGVNEMLSGNLVGLGVPPAAGVRLAVKEINDRGGFTVGNTSYRFQLIEVDNRSEGAAAMAGTVKLVEDDKVKFVFGPLVGAFAMQTLQITVPANVIHFSPAGGWQSEGILTDPKRPLLFGTQNPRTTVARIDAEGLRQFGIRKIAFISADDETTKTNMPAFFDEMKSAGITVVTILFPPKTTDFSSFVTRAKGENVEGIYFLYPQAQAPDLLRAIVELFPTIKGFGGQGMDPNLAVKTAIGKPLPFPFFTTLNTPSFDYPANAKVKAFVDRMKAFQPNLGGSTANFAFFTYDYVFMLVEAMKRAGTVDDTAKIAQALQAITYDGVAGKICFGKEMRTASMDSGQLLVRDGRIEAKTGLSPCK